MSIEQFLENYDPKVREVCEQLRTLAKELTPEMEEFLFPGWKNISYGKSRSDKDLFFYIAPFKDSVNLGFFRGTSLQDKNNLLKGTGKHMRHIKIKSMAEVDLKAISSMILEAQEEGLRT